MTPPIAGRGAGVRGGGGGVVGDTQNDRGSKNSTHNKNNPDFYDCLNDDLSEQLPTAIAQFRYIKIQHETITSLRGFGEQIVEFIWVYSPEPRSDVYCFRLNFNIWKLDYWFFELNLRTTNG